MKTSDSFIKLYDCYVIRIYKLMNNLYSQNENKVVYTVYSAVTLLGLFFVLPLLLIIEGVLRLDLESTVPIVLNIVFIFGLAFIHYRRYKSVKVLERLLRDTAKVTSSRRLVFNLSWTVLTIVLWSIAVMLL